MLRGHTRAVYAVACARRVGASDSGDAVIASTSPDKSVRLWSLREQTELLVCTGHTKTVRLEKGERARGRQYAVGERL